MCRDTFPTVFQILQKCRVVGISRDDVGLLHSHRCRSRSRLSSLYHWRTRIPIAWGASWVFKKRKYVVTLEALYVSENTTASHYNCFHECSISHFPPAHFNLSWRLGRSTPVHIHTHCSFDLVCGRLPIAWAKIITDDLGETQGIRLSNTLLPYFMPDIRPVLRGTDILMGLKICAGHN